MMRFVFLFTMMGLCLIGSFAKVSVERRTLDRPWSDTHMVPTHADSVILNQDVNDSDMIPNDTRKMLTELKLIEVLVPDLNQETMHHRPEQVQQKSSLLSKVKGKLHPRRFLPFWGTEPGSLRFRPWLEELVDITMDATAFRSALRV
jgi:hypothetical protein